MTFGLAMPCATNPHLLIFLCFFVFLDLLLCLLRGHKHMKIRYDSPAPSAICTIYISTWTCLKESERSKVQSVKLSSLVRLLFLVSWEGMKQIQESYMESGRSRDLWTKREETSSALFMYFTDRALQVCWNPALRFLSSESSFFRTAQDFFASCTALHSAGGSLVHTTKDHLYTRITCTHWDSLVHIQKQEFELTCTHTES